MYIKPKLHKWKVLQKIIGAFLGVQKEKFFCINKRVYWNIDCIIVQIITSVIHWAKLSGKGGKYKQKVIISLNCDKHKAKHTFFVEIIKNLEC